MLILDFSTLKMLETKRLLLQKLTFQNVEDIYQLRSNPLAMKYIGKPVLSSSTEAAKLVNMYIGNLNENTCITLGISHKDNPARVIGTMGYHMIDKNHYRAEIGYMLDPSYWGQGLMSEALKCFIDYGLKDLGLHSIEAQINPDNHQSSRILLKHGFIKEAHFRENYFFGGKFQDTEVYSLVKK